LHLSLVFYKWKGKYVELERELQRERERERHLDSNIGQPLHFSSPGARDTHPDYILTRHSPDELFLMQEFQREEKKRRRKH
jgi:hypothetical protein